MKCPTRKQTKPGRGQASPSGTRSSSEGKPNRKLGKRKAEILGAMDVQKDRVEMLWVDRKGIAIDPKRIPPYLPSVWRKWVEGVERMMREDIASWEQVKLNPKTNRWGKATADVAIRDCQKILNSLGIKVVVKETGDPVKPFFMEITRRNSASARRNSTARLTSSRRRRG